MPQTFLGLDIGQSTIKAVVLAKKGLTGGHILASRIIEINEIEGVEPALKKLSEDKIFCGIPCGVSLPPAEMMFRQVNLPFHDDNRIRKTLAFELEPLIPLPIEDVIADYLMIPHDGLLVAAMTKNNVRYWIEKVEETLGNVSIIDISTSALAAQITDNRKQANCGMILDIGRYSTNVAFYEDNAIVHIRSLAFGGHLVTEALAGDISVTKDEAENIKISDNFSQAGAKTVEACRHFCSELKNTAEYMKINGALQNDPTRIVLTGGGSLFNPLQAELRNVFSSNIEILDLINTKQLEIEKNIQNKFSPQIMNTAIAAALRISTGRKSFNFRQGDFAAKNTGLNFKKQIKWAGIITGIIIALAVFNQLFDYGLKTKRLNVIKKQIAFTFQKNFPEADNINESIQLQYMETKLDENKKTFAFYEDLPETTTIELLKEISRLIPASANIIISGLIYEKGVISLKGEANTIDDVTSIKNELLKSKYFKEVTMGATSLTKDGGKVEFNLRIEVK